MSRINERREKFRQDIRSREREAFFATERRKFDQLFRPTMHLATIIANLTDKDRLEETLEELARLINGPQFFSEVMELIDCCLLSRLKDLLHQEICLKKTLEIVGFLLQKFSKQRHMVNIFERFRELFLMELALGHLPNLEVTADCVFIIHAYSEASNDYCEILAEGEGYKPLIQFLSEAVLRSPSIEQESQLSAKKTYKYILYVLENIMMASDSTVDISLQKQEIFRFACWLAARRVFLQITLGLIYESIKALSRQLCSEFLPLLNDLIAELRPEDRHIQNLLAVVYLFSPSPAVRYEELFRASAMVPKMYNLVSLVLEKLVAGNCEHRIPQGEINQPFWEKLLINHADEDTFRRTLSVISPLRCYSTLVWRVISSSTEDAPLPIKKELLDLLLRKVKAEDKVEAYSQVRKFRVEKMLEKLSFSKNQAISMKASDILSYTTGRLREECQLVVQI